MLIFCIKFQVIDRERVEGETLGKSEKGERWSEVEKELLPAARCHFSVARGRHKVRPASFT